MPLRLLDCPLGSVIVCEIYHLFEHSGIYLGDGQIVELAGSGLVRAVSSTRFLDNRSGEHLLALCDTNGRPVGNAAGAERAAAQLFSYQHYDLLRNNCHQFVGCCLTGQNRLITSFFDLRTELEQFYRVRLSPELVRP